MEEGFVFFAGIVFGCFLTYTCNKVYDWCCSAEEAVERRISNLDAHFRDMTSAIEKLTVPNQPSPIISTLTATVIPLLTAFLKQRLDHKIQEELRKSEDVFNPFRDISSLCKAPAKETNAAKQNAEILSELAVIRQVLERLQEQQTKRDVPE